MIYNLYFTLYALCFMLYTLCFMLDTLLEVENIVQMEAIAMVVDSMEVANYCEH